MSNFKTITIALISLATIVGTVASGTSVAQERSQCFMVGANGELLDLTSVCSPASSMGNKTKTKPSPQVSPEPTPTPEATPEPSTTQGNNDTEKKTPANSNIRYNTSPSGLTGDAEDTGTTEKKRKDDRAELRRESARTRSLESQSQ
jgi:site-specific DNA-cytosine methylase